jgi:hypothetical protein
MISCRGPYERKGKTELDLGELNVDRTFVHLTAFDYLEMLAEIAEKLQRAKKAHKLSVAKNQSERRIACLRRSA